jgi:hypothetical protein
MAGIAAARRLRAVLAGLGALALVAVALPGGAFSAVSATEGTTISSASIGSGKTVI